MAVESLTEVNPLAAFIGFFILIILIVACSKVFNSDNLEDYIPKWFK
jgi:hypothetical protein